MTRARALPWLLLLFLPLPAFAGGWDSVRSFFYDTGLLETLKRVGIAVGVLFIGWLVARSLEKVVYSLLRKTDLDNRLFAAVGLESLFKSKDGKGEDRVERISGRIVFYTVMLLAIAGALDAAGLGDTAGPLRAFVQTIVEALPFVGKAALIVIVFYVAGLLLKKIVSRALGRLDGRFVEATDGTTRAKFSESAGSVVFWLAMLVGLAGAFESLQIDVVATPLKNMLTTVIEAVPALAMAGLIVLIGYIIGRLARAVIANLLATAGIDALPGKVKLDQVFAKRKLSDMLGLTAMVFILLHAGIAALDRLGLTAVSKPVSRIIEQFWEMAPSIAVAIGIVIVGVFLARLARGLVTGLLESLGVDARLKKIGVDFERLHNGDPEAKRAVDTPSEFAGLVAQVGIIMLAVIESLNRIGFKDWAGMVREALDFLVTRGVVAAVIVAIGFALANFVRKLIIERRPGDASMVWAAGAARIAILVFAFTMALQQLNVASNFILLSFALVFGALCLALALAFGLGARDVAGDIVKKQYDKAKKD